MKSIRGTNIQEQIDEMQNSDFGTNTELIKIFYGNIQSNERLRNNLFSLYLAIAAAFFGFQGNDILGMDVAMTDKILTALVWAIGILFLGAFIRYKGMIRRDVDLAFVLQKKLLCSDSELIGVFEEYCESINTKHRRVISVSSTLVVLTLLVSLILMSILFVSLFWFFPAWAAWVSASFVSVLINGLIFFVYGGSLATFSDNVAILSGRES